jgi:hypothetical protein
MRNTSHQDKDIIADQQAVISITRRATGHAIARISPRLPPLPVTSGRRWEPWLSLRSQ